MADRAQGARASVQSMQHKSSGEVAVRLPFTAALAEQVALVGTPPSHAGGAYVLILQLFSPPCSAPSTVPQPQSCPSRTTTSSQPPPPASQAHVPQLRLSLKPRCQVCCVVAVGQLVADGCAQYVLSLIYGTHTKPAPQPPPRALVLHSFMVVAQTAGSGVGEPLALHAPG